MKRFFDTELENFRMQLVLMGETAIEQVRHAIRALAEGDIDLAGRVVAADDELDGLELRIDDEAMRYMNLRAPVATDLRLVIVGMKASHDLERVGDEAAGIAKRAARLAAAPPGKPCADLPRMAEMAIAMLRDALDCFLNADVDKAVAVIRRDEAVDRLNQRLYRALTGCMIEDPPAIGRAIELMFICKSIERIADHATNIAEEMIYLFQARDVRHDDSIKAGGAGA
jgi:phosphate transport system protein